MRELGLDDKGTRKVLVSRHQRFTALWNAQCEASKPQSKLEIIMQVRRGALRAAANFVREEREVVGLFKLFHFFKLRKEEQTEKKETAAAAAVRSNLLDYDRNTDPGEIELKKREYMKQNKGSFDDLMRAARMGHSKVRTLTWSSERKMRMVLRTSRQYRKMRTCIRPRRLRTTSNPESCM